MHPKSPISLPNFPDLTFSSKSKKPSSSLYQCLSIGLLEILIAFKLNLQQIAATYTSLCNILVPVTELIDSKNLNADILNNYSKILNLIHEEKSQSKAFSYLKYYSESNDPNCYISLEYGLRFILAYLLKHNQDDFELIINDSPLLNYSEALDLLARELKIAVILIENSEKRVFCDKDIEKLPNLFILKGQDSFDLLSPGQYVKLESSGFSFEAVSYPFVTVQRAKSISSPVVNSKPRQSVSKKDKIIKKKSKGEPNQPLLFRPVARQGLGATQMAYSTLKNPGQGKFFSVDEQESSFQIPDLGTPYNPLVLQVSEHLNAPDSESNNPEEVFDINEVIEMRLSKLGKSLKLFEKILEVPSLDCQLSIYVQKHRLKKRINILQIDFFLQEALPDQDIELIKLIKICKKIHRPTRTTRLEEKEFWKLIMNCGVLPNLDSINKTLFSKVVSQLLAFITQKSKQVKALINTLNS